MKNYFLKCTALVVFSVSVSCAQAQKIDYDKKIGAEQSQIIAEQMGIYDDEEMTAYIRSIGNRLLEHLEVKNFEYHFHLVPDPSPNAFALPGGYIYITTGLIPILESEDELACIMAHEIIHSNNRHSVKQMRKGILPAILKIPGSILGVLNESLGAVFQAPSYLMVASYSRKYETEADLEGVALASKAGYDPRALKSALARLSNSISVITGEEEEKSYFSDHPYTGDRVDNIEKQSSQLPEVSESNTIANYKLKFSGVLYGSDPQYGIVKEDQIILPIEGISMKVPEGWQAGIESHRAITLNEKQTAAVAIVKEDEFATAAEAADAFVKEIPPEYHSNLLRDSYKDGQVVVVKESTNQGLVFAHVFWLKYEGQLMQIVGLSTREEISTIKEQVDGIKLLSAKEQAAITISNMKVVKSKGNETLAQLAERMENQLSPGMLEAINEMKSDDVLAAGQLVKIVVNEPYVK